MRGLLSAIQHACAYMFPFAAVFYAAGFAQNVLVPKTVDSGAGGDLAASILVNAGLLSLFALQRLAAARPGLRRAWTRIAPPAADRWAYALLTGLAFVLLVWLWRPLPQLVWRIDHPDLAGMLTMASWAGWAVLLASGLLIDQARRFGVNRNLAHLLALPRLEASHAAPFVYRRLRHAIYAAVILAFWATPQMSLGHLILAMAVASHLFIIWLEERDIVARFGDRHRHYRKAVGMLLPRLRTPAQAL